MAYRSSSAPVLGLDHGYIRSRYGGENCMAVEKKLFLRAKVVSVDT